MQAAELDQFITEWQARMVAWIHEQLDRVGASLAGEIEPRLRPWSVVLRVPTDAGLWWFKANSPASSFEPVLTQALGRWQPGQVLTPIAVKPELGWWLLPDGGTSLRAVLDTDPDPRHWEAVLAQFASFQRAVADRADQLLAMGVPDLRPAALPELFDMLLVSPQVRDQVGVKHGLPAATYDAITRLRPRFVEWCERLAASGVPPSLDHADLHDGQVFRTATGWAFIDWADAAVGHPFGVLQVALERAAQRFSLPTDAAELARLRDAYLEAWTAEHGIAELREAARLATRLAVVSRAMGWHRTFSATDEYVWDMHGKDVAGLLSRLLQPLPAWPL